MKWRFWITDTAVDDNKTVINDSEMTHHGTAVNPMSYPENALNYSPYGYDDYSNLESRYIHDWLARAAINYPIDDSIGVWREWPDKYKVKIKAEEKRLKYKQKLKDALVTADVHGGCLLVMFVNNQSDLSAPLDIKNIQQGDLVNVGVFDPLMVSKTDINDTNPASPRYLEPEFYEIAGATKNGRIHHSRCIELHGMEYPLISRRLIGNSAIMWGLSRLEPILPVIDDYNNCQSFASRALKYLAAIFVKEPGVSHARTTKAFSRIQMAISQLAKAIGRSGIYYGDSRTEMGSTGITLTGVKDLIDKKNESVSGAMEVPVTRLFFLAKDGMSGDTNSGDQKNYYGALVKYRNKKIERIEALEEALIRSSLGSFPADCVCEWNEVSVHTEVEKADIETKRAEARERDASANLKNAQAKSTTKPQGDD